VRRFLVHFRPAVGVLMETEVWPNLLAAADALDVPMVLANARLSERSQRRGRRFEALMRPAAQSVALVLAQSEADAARLSAAGARNVVVSGNLKFDMTRFPRRSNAARPGGGHSGDRSSSPRSHARARRRRWSRPGRRGHRPGRCCSSCRATRSASTRSPGCCRAPG
jgi:3-deoxy-D-manno-octulosonic-acid transferase